MKNKHNLNLVEMKIENYKNITNFKIDLKSNINGSEAEIKLGKFKPILNNTYILPSFVGLIGRNAIGKSNILSAILLVKDLFSEELTNIIASQIFIEEKSSGFGSNIFLQTAENANLHKDITKQIHNKVGKYYDKYKVKFNKITHEWFNELAKDTKIPIKISFTFVLNSNEKIEYEFQYFENEINVDISKDNSSYEKNKELFMLLLEYFKNIQDLQYFSHDTSIKRIIRNGINHSKNNVDVQLINNALVKLYLKLGIKKLTNLVQLADPNIIDINIYNLKKDEYAIKNIIISDQIKHIEHLSTGTKYFILITSLIIDARERGNTIVLIDEIENNLHIELINAIKYLMLDAFNESNVQFIFTTHSPMVINTLMSKKQVFSIEEEDEKVLAKKATFAKPIESLITKYEKGDIAMYPDKEFARNTISMLFWKDEDE